MNKISNNLSVTLVEPQGDWNIGAVARAMKNFGFTKLKLVNPVNFNTELAYATAMTARDVLDGAVVYKDVMSAVGEMTFVVGLSRRLRQISIPVYSLMDAVPKIIERTANGPVTLMFGREDDGLSNDEISKCDMIVHIPTSPMFGSLNLAQAVLLACYEIFKVSAVEKVKTDGSQFVSHKEMETVFVNLELALKRLEYDDKDGGKLRGKIIDAFRHIFGRAGLEEKDVKMMLGLCARVEEKVDPRKTK